jgi:dihydrolipoamide dehydrogenase
MAVVAMEFRGSAEDIGMICHAHPSLLRGDEGRGARVDKRALNI